MRQATVGTAGAIAFTLLMACRAAAQTLNISPGVAPGSEHWTQKERIVEHTPLGAVVFNLVTPTLTVFLPDRSKATGTGVIIAPGGAFVALAIDLEGYKVARRLQKKGIATFVFKDRIMEKQHEGIPAGMNMDESGKYGIADGIQAIKVVRPHATEWGIAPDRVGFLGFFGRRHGGERRPAPSGHRGASEVRCPDLWRSVRRDAGHSGDAATHFYGVGAG
jgi:hypothetical protein